MRLRAVLVAGLRLVAGMALVLGVPTALVLGVGWPLPRELPSLEAIGEALSRQGVPVEVMMKTLAVIVWVAWAQLTIAVVVESVATVKGRQAGRAPVLPGVQLLAGQIVAASALLVSLLGPLRARGDEAADPIAIARLELVAGPRTPALPAGPTGQPAAASEGTDEAHVVQRGDSYWAIAKRELGDGMRWREIRDLNVGRIMPDGHTITADDTVLRPGWRINKPATAAATADSGPATLPPTASNAVDAAYVVQPGDSFWSIAVDQLGGELGRPPTNAEIVPRWQRLIAANEGRYRSGDPDLIYPGEAFEVPQRPRDRTSSTDAPSGTEQPTASHDDTEPDETATVPDLGDTGARTEEPWGPHGPPVTAPESKTDADAGPGAGDDTVGGPGTPEGPDEGGSTPSRSPTTTAPGTRSHPSAREAGDDGAAVVPIAGGLLGVAGSVLGVWVLRSWRRRRARGVTRRPVDSMPAPPPRGARSLQHELLVTADDEAVDRMDAAIAHFATGLRPRGENPCPQPRLVQITGGRIEVLLDRPNPSPPSPWRPDVSGLIWVLSEDTEVEPSDDVPSPMPALVTLGVGECTVMVDLEAYGVVSLCGDPTACRGLARSMVTELSARAGRGSGVVVVGSELSSSLGELEGVRLAGSWGDIDIDDVETRRAVLRRGRWPHAFAARASGRGYDGWTPAVWVTTPSDHPNYRDGLSLLRRETTGGTAMLVVGDDAGYGLQVMLNDAGDFHIPELDLRGRTQMISDRAVEEVVELLGDDAGTATAPVDEPPPQALGFFDAPTNDDDTTEPKPSEQDAEATTGGLSVVIGGPDHAIYDDPHWDVLVHLCGDIYLEGRNHDLTRHDLTPRETAVAAYVALCGDVNVEQLREAVWRRPVTRKTVGNVISAVRNSLGEAVRWLDDGRVGPGPGLFTDVELIRRRMAYAQHQDNPADRAATLRGAMEWVNGRVCAYPRAAKQHWTWIDLDNWISYVDAVVGAAACELGRIYLTLHDSEGACWAARAGMCATGPREELTLLLVQGYELAGDEAAAGAALRAYLAHLDELDVDEYSDALSEVMERHLRDRAAG